MWEYLSVWNLQTFTPAHAAYEVYDLPYGPAVGNAYWYSAVQSIHIFWFGANLKWTGEWGWSDILIVAYLYVAMNTSLYTSFDLQNVWNRTVLSQVHHSQYRIYKLKKAYTSIFQEKNITRALISHEVTWWILALSFLTSHLLTSRAKCTEVGRHVRAAHQCWSYKSLF